MVVPELYLNWLRWNKEREGFQNSIYYALLAHHLFEVQNQNCTFKMPIHILSRELEAEERQQQASTIIRKYVIHLLEIATGEQINHKNYEEEMFKYFENHRSLRGAEGLNPLVKERPFHSISSESKMYCICYLLTNCQVVMLDSLTLLETDTLKNNFFIVNGGKLYLQMGKQLQELVEKDDGDEELTLFDRHLRKIDRWQLVAETECAWKTFPYIVKSFKQKELAKALSKEWESAIASIATPDQLRDEWNNLKGYLHSIEQPKKKVSKAAAVAPSSELTSREPEPTSEQSFPEPPPSQQEGNTSIPIRRQYESDEEKEVLPPAQAQQPANSNAGRATARGTSRVRFSQSSRSPVNRRSNGAINSQSQAPSHEQTPAAHASRPTERGSSRPRSSSRIRSSASSADSRSAANTNQNDSIAPDQEQFARGGAGVPNQHGRENAPRAPRQRCPMWNVCPNGRFCQFVHPSPKHPCRHYPNCQFGRDCTWYHGACPKDGECKNFNCSLEHRQQIPPRAQAEMDRARWTNANNGTMNA